MKKQLMVLAAASVLTFSQFVAPALTIDNVQATTQETNNMKKKSKGYKPTAANEPIKVEGKKTDKQYKNTQEEIVKAKEGKVSVSDKKPVHIADASKKYAKGELIVKFKRGNGPSSIGTAGRALELKSQKTFKTSGAHLYTFNASKKSVDEAIKTLKATGAFEYVEPNYIVKATTISDPLYSNQWGANNTGQAIQGWTGLNGFDIDAETAWGKTLGDSSLVVGVIDTGTDINHPDLADNIWTNSGEIPNDGLDNDGNGYIDDVNGWDFYYADNSVYDYSWEDGHGTHVSGTIAANDNSIGVRGIAPNVKIMPLKFLGGYDGSGYTSDAILAIEYAKAKGVKILNNSWGGGEYSTALKETIENSGTLFIAAAGNDGTNTDAYPEYPASYDSDNILSVGSADNDGFRSWFSNYGVNTVDVFAPGGDIISTVPKEDSALDYSAAYGYKSGTSMATPHVSGVAALIASHSPSLTPLAIKSTIMQTSTEYNSLYYYSQTGGLINAGKAVGYSPDNDIPGLPLSGQHTAGTLHATEDLDDVFAVTLDAKEKIKLDLTGASGTDFDLYLFNPAAQTVHTSQNIIAYSEQAGTSTESIEFIAPHDGTYYIDVYAYAGNGSYDLHVVQGAQAGAYENTAYELNYTNRHYPNICYGGYCDWTLVNDSLASGGNYATMNDSEKTVKFAFYGKGIKYNAIKGSTNGIAKVTIDGQYEYFVDLYFSTTAAATVFEKTDLEPGRHTFQIEWTGKAGNGGRKTATNVTLDTLEVIGEQTETVVEDDNANVKYGETWSKATSSTYSGGSLAYINKTGASATFKFNGTGIKYYALKSRNYGFVDVYIDDVKVETVNLYSSASKYKQLVFEKNDLTAGEHIIKIISTGTKDPSSTSTNINIDNFIVLNAGTSIKIEDNDPFMKYVNTWLNASNTVYNGGTLKYTNIANSSVEYTFNGTGVAYYTSQASSYGQANVYIDNNLVDTVDLYNKPTKHKAKVFESASLVPGNHTIKIVHTGLKNASSSATNITLDYLEIKN
ncbi:S8 family serine peptidase [Domibacillus mangrovi]|uniref:Peptidase S8/S53 domain-containing protein n=1 Tax=Domibacillus mangrovi TaxID=1714354 RepID=A0A1Q5NZC9_9BACI|nr:S8 family serine peptidase [Domibacillus mangrovi]OKL35222.1 hypothetical protein BLL40_16635 [Domibacillus mangrovi]